MFRGDDGSVTTETKERELGIPSAGIRLLLTLGSVASFVCGCVLLILLPVLLPVEYGYGVRSDGKEFENTLFTFLNFSKLLMIATCFFISGFYMWCSRSIEYSGLNSLFIVGAGVMQFGFIVLMVQQVATANSETINYYNYANDYRYACAADLCSAVPSGDIRIDTLGVPLEFWLAIVASIAQFVISCIGLFFVFRQGKEGKNLLSTKGLFGVFNINTPISVVGGEYTPTNPSQTDIYTLTNRKTIIIDTGN